MRNSPLSLTREGITFSAQALPLAIRRSIYRDGSARNGAFGQLERRVVHLTRK